LKIKNLIIFNLSSDDYYCGSKPNDFDMAVESYVTLVLDFFIKISLYAKIIEPSENACT
jgi:hypothetical protein